MRFTIEHLKKYFETKEVLRDVNFTFESGKIYGLLGRNGAGKTTLFNCLNRDLPIDGGRFYLEEHPRLVHHRFRSTQGIVHFQFLQYLRIQFYLPLALQQPVQPQRVLRSPVLGIARKGYCQRRVRLRCLPGFPGL